MDNYGIGQHTLQGKHSLGEVFVEAPIKIIQIFVYSGGI